MATPPTPAHANTVGWYILEGYPWWPVYICDQFKLRAHLHQLGDGHKKILKKAKDFHRDYALVYYFGSHDFSAVKLNKGILKPWDCSEKDQYVKGLPKHLMKKGTVADDLSFAIQEVEDYLSQPEDIRLPPHMVPSDLDPTLEPPPPMERPEEMEDVEGEDGEAESDADDGEDADADGDEDMDDDGEKKAKKKPAKETKKKASSKKEKTEKEKKPKKEKKEKVTKPPKEKKEKAKTPVKEKKVSAAKKKSDDAAMADTPKEKTAKLKRQRSSGGDDDADANDIAKASKQPKKDKAADVKSSETGGAAPNDSEDLQEILEREIRWILSNEQYEEMTTKMLRKVLEERLKRDLKQHREAIKAVVTRVIEEEEDAAADTTSVATEVAIPSAAVGSEDAAKDEASGQEDADGDVKMAEDETEKTEKTSAESEPTPEPLVPSNAEKPTEADDDDAPEEPTKEEEVVKEEVEKGEGEVEAEVEAEKETEAAPPKPVEEADILAIKDKLLDDKTPHDELLACLNELQQMPLDFSHLKQTGIPRVVAKLRQHANDKVSIAAKELRNAWMELVEKEKQPKSLKMLEKMRDTLESETEPETAKLSVLKELTKLKLSTQEIIDAKIGVSISKLRKSSNADVAQAANNLRQKWRKMAQSS